MGSLSRGREAAPSTRRKTGVLSSAALRFISSAVSTRADCTCLPRCLPFVGVLPCLGWLEPVSERCPVPQSWLGEHSQKGSTEHPCKRQLAQPRACRCICAADVSVLLWSGIVANAGFLLLFSVDCSLGLRLQALLK